MDFYRSTFLAFRCGSTHYQHTSHLKNVNSIYHQILIIINGCPQFEDFRFMDCANGSWELAKKLSTDQNRSSSCGLAHRPTPWVEGRARAWPVDKSAPFYFLSDQLCFINDGSIMTYTYTYTYTCRVALWLAKHAQIVISRRFLAALRGANVQSVDSRWKLSLTMEREEKERNA